MNGKKDILISLMVALLALFSFSIDFSSLDSLVLCFPGYYELFFSLLAAILFHRVKKLRTTGCILSIVYAVFLVIGRAMFKYDWDERIPFGGGDQLYKWLLAFPGFFFVSMPTVHAAFEVVESKGKDWVNSTYTIRMDRHPLLYPWMGILLLQSFSYLCCYPGIMIPGDNVMQVYQFTKTFVDGGAELTTHHPVVHTLLLGGFIWGGKLFLGSETVGYGLYSAFQMMFCSFCLARMMQFLKDNAVASSIRWGLIVFYGFNPIFSNIMAVSTKDVWYVSFLLLFIIMIAKELQGKGNVLWLFLTGLLCLLSRNEGLYVVLVPLCTMWFMKHHRKCGISVAAALVIASLLIGNILYPAARITPGNRREGLSVPMQMMARYIAGHKGEWTKEEEKSIAAVLDIENVAKWYDPNSVDPVKTISNGNAKAKLTGEDVCSFLWAWVNCGLRHPMTYVDAFLEMKDQYFYPASITGITKVSPNQLTSENSWYSFETLKSCHLQLAYPEQLKNVRTAMDHFRSRAMMLPVVRLFCIAPTYTWLALLVIFYFIGRKAWTVCPLTMLVLVLVGVLFVTPLDGHDFRYSFPVAYILPFCALLNLKLLYPQKQESVSNGIVNGGT